MYTKENCGKMSSTKEDLGSNQQNADADYSLAQSRSRRQKVDKKGRLSAFEKLRQAKEKGIKNKYEIEEEKNVYDVVDEGEYSELVRQRQEDDWIIDDDGAGYVEDGREIFDDEMDEDAPIHDSKKKKQEQKNKNIVRPGTKPKQDIKSMFAAAASNLKVKPERDISLANDDMLDDLLKELDTKKKPTEIKFGSFQKNAPVQKRAAQNPFKVESKSIKQPQQPQNDRLNKQIKRELSYPEDDIHPPKVSKSAMVEDVEIKSEIPDDTEILEVSTDFKNESVDLSGIDFDVEMSEALDISGIHEMKPNISEKTVPVKNKFSEENFMVGWQHQSEPEEAPLELQVDSSHLPLVKNNADEPCLRFYWLDAFEDPYHQPE